MELLGIGIDLVDLARIRGARHLNRVAEYILTPEEHVLMQTHQDAIQYVGSRLAVKEAVIKASPTPLSYHDIVVDKEEKRPIIRFIQREHQQLHAFVSLAHTEEYATALANVYRRA
jgi:holo-[acyl-carrier-protein] synthase